MNIMSIEKLNLSDLVQVNFPENEYYKIEKPKKQICLHHTVSGGKSDGSINWWIQDPERIAVPFIIDDTGKIFQLFSSKYWANHLGIRSSFLKNLGFSDYSTRNRLLNEQTIGIELCRWGGLIKDDKGYHPTKWDSKLGKEVANKKIVIPDSNVQIFDKPFRGYKYFEKYTPEQIKSVTILVNYLCEKFSIPKTYNDTMWDVSKDALGGKPGIWSHVSYRSDKSDLFPQTELIHSLKTLIL